LLFPSMCSFLLVPSFTFRSFPSTVTFMSKSYARYSALITSSFALSSKTRTNSRLVPLTIT
jgi:hypothetical protein